MARLLVALIILYPLSFVRVDQRGSALLPMVIQLERTSPAFAAFEDVINNYPEKTPQVHEEPHTVVRLVSGIAFKPEVPEADTPMIQVALEPLRISRAKIKEVVEPVAWDDPNTMPSLSKRKKILLSRISSDVLVQPSATELAKKLVEKELTQITPGVRNVATHDGRVIIVQKPEVSTDDGRSPYVAYNHKESSLLLTGDVRINGLPLDLGKEGTHWKVFRRFNGEVQETGSINIQQARFQIRVESRKGTLVAELSDQWGHVWGRGEVPLRQQNKLALNVNPVESPTVAAYTPSFTDPALADGVGATYKPFGNSLLEKSTNQALDVSQYSTDSRFYIEAATKNHFPTVALGFISELQKIPLYTLKSIKAFYEIVRSFYRPLDLTNQALLWGEVTRNGKPLSGAEIEVASHQGKVIYFNEIGIPRKDINTTTSSGQFAIANVEEGVQAVRVHYSGKTFPARVVPSYAGKITHVNLEIPTKFHLHALNFFSLDETRENVPTTFRLVGATSSFDFPELKEISLPVLQDGMMVEWDSGPGYELMRTQLPPLPNQKRLDLPVISSEWIQSLAQSAGKVLDRRLGWAIGFSSDTDAEVLLKNNRDGLYDVIYFDQDLKLWNGSTLPAGGGFIVFNIPLGYQTIEVRPLQSAQSHAESFVSEPYFLYLVGSQGFLQPFGQKNL